jgi:RNA recognition motif-containing protein
MKIYVGKLTEQTTADGLKELFSRYGDVADAYIVNDKETGASRGFGFVFMPDVVQARAAMTRLNGPRVEGKSLVVSPPKEKGKKQAAKPGRPRGGPSANRNRGFRVRR